MRNLLILLITTSFIFGCEKESLDSSSPTIDSCSFSQSLEEVNQLIDEARNRQIDSASEIEENLIGTWALNGVIPGWTNFEPSSECLMLSITAESLSLKNLDTDEEFNSNWGLKSFEFNDNVSFYLQPDNDELRWLVGMELFSNNIMYGAGFAFDSDTYVYQKVE